MKKIAPELVRRKAVLFGQYALPSPEDQVQSAGPVRVQLRCSPFPPETIVQLIDAFRADGAQGQETF
ncbi:hypothetical protein L6654_07750 [Bradyrhizobium sp. WYCCWR 13023]|uniref:Uncharacterized protein n=1 Tax=Bradyrhizobium zhengyangense TaxID=2911009 RepID=A0A9X1RA69_9BRAD|nr:MULTISPECIES: hypothetical protein [Bradyrhizobium]MCG2626515.1 hypothetical protein [Bradyrhizobium zhengyangense]MCG2665712.1 hypothetical protein [Bradyrhizobium zhengyangense]MDA9524037.1 hypothetical protein [Bradyrhizobium sp. CCBAU 11434]